MTRTRWIILAIVAFLAFFAVVIGGFLWPRPQWDKGPWNRDRAPMEAPPAPPAG